MDTVKPLSTKSNCLFCWCWHSLHWRLLTLVGLMLVVTLLVIGLGVIYFVYNNEQRIWQGRQTEAARYANEIVAAFLEGTQHTLRLVGLLEHEELRAQTQLMADLLQESPTLLEIIRLDGQGQVLASAYRDAPLLANLFTIPQSRWFLQSRAGALYLGTVQLSAESEPYLIIALPTPNGGVVAARLHMRLLWDVVASLHFGQTGQAYVVNQDGLVIAHTDRSVPVSNIRLMDRPEIGASLQARGQNWAGSYVNFQGQEVVGVSAPVAGTDWLVITELPTREAFATSRTALLIFGLGLALFGLLVMLVTGRLLRQLILTPMEKLREGANRLGGGDLTYRIDLNQQNEVGQVAAAFNGMAARLRQQRDELEQRHAELEVMIQTSLSLTANLDLKTVLDAILNSTFKLSPQTEDVHLFLYQDGHLDFATSLWADGRKDYLIAEPRPSGMTYQVAQRGELIVVPDIQNHPLYANAPAEWQGALVGLPLKIGTGVVGVMNVAYAKAREFGEAELGVLRLLGDQAAIAIENARLYEQAQQQLIERKRAEEALHRLNEELENRVAARTAELIHVNRELVQEIWERQRVEATLRQSEIKYRTLVEQIPAVAYIAALDEIGTTLYVSPQIEKLLGFSAAEWLANPESWSRQLHPDDRHEVLAKAAQLYSTNKSFLSEYRLFARDGQEIWVRDEAMILPTEEGQEALLQGVIYDITIFKEAETKVKTSLHEKEILLKEIHHRVKNNLQVISSLLNLQSNYINDPQALGIFKDSQNRVRSMALIHEKLYNSANLAQIDFGDYIRELASYLFRAQSAQTQGITLNIQADEVFLDIDRAVPCGLILNELVSNSLKHAFPNGTGGAVHVGVHVDGDNQFSLIVGDNGIGLPQDLDFRNTTSLGLQLVDILVNQLEGTIELDRSKGTKFRIMFTDS